MNKIEFNQEILGKEIVDSIIISSYFTPERIKINSLLRHIDVATDNSYRDYQKSENLYYSYEARNNFLNRSERTKRLLDD